MKRKDKDDIRTILSTLDTDWFERQTKQVKKAHARVWKLIGGPNGA